MRVWSRKPSSEAPAVARCWLLAEAEYPSVPCSSGSITVKQACWWNDAGGA